MDSGDREKAMTDSIKQIVKHTSRREGRLGSALQRIQERYGGQRLGGNVVKIASKDFATSEPSSPTDVGTGSKASGLIRSSLPVTSTFIFCAMFATDLT